MDCRTPDPASDVLRARLLACARDGRADCGAQAATGDGRNSRADLCGGHPAVAGGERTGNARRRRAHIRGRAHRTQNTTTRSTTVTRPREPLPASSPSRPSRAPRAPDCLPRLLLPAHPDLRPPSACRRPASGPPANLPGLPCPISLASRGRGVQRVSGGPFLGSPGVMRIWAGGGAAARWSPTTDTYRPTLTNRCLEADSVKAVTAVVPRAVRGGKPSAL